jgi:hypothetical protein
MDAAKLSNVGGGAVVAYRIGLNTSGFVNSMHPCMHG